MKHYQITLPVGAKMATSCGDILVHRGGGVFTSEKPVWVLEGEVALGSAEAGAWPQTFDVTRVEVDADVRRVTKRATGYLTGPDALD